MIFLKIYIFIAMVLYILIGLYLFKIKKMTPLMLLALIVFSILWLPLSAYEILFDKE